jgi:uncharacterized protein YqjF (DUF2071 family)
VKDLQPERSFLTAEWRHLVMLNYESDPALVAGHVPAGCELDGCNGRTFISIVGFQFLDTRVLGAPIPFHRHFEEVNLRFYVRRKVDGAWRRGVVFVKELVPRWAIAFVARRVYGEPYTALPMRHQMSVEAASGETTVSYEWRRGGRWEGVRASYIGAPAVPADDAEETFITEHYWGYTRRRDGATVEYQVEHPRWRVWRAVQASFECDVASLYGPDFAGALSGTATTAFVADGSPVVVRRGRRLK